MEYEEKKQKLHEIIDILTRQAVAVAFSGGVDSSLILKLAAIHCEKKGTKVYALTANTELHPAGDMEVAKRTATEIGAEHEIIPINELVCAGVQDNSKERCYLCKKNIFKSIQELAKEKGISTIIEGTNIDDTHAYRPGLKALAELGIKSPLKDAEFTKADVRILAAEYGISTASRPSTPCMATRFPYGTRITVEKLKKVEQGEKFLKSLGYENHRLRVHDNIARIEIDAKNFVKLIFDRELIVNNLKKIGYDYVTLDLQGFRSGSMDEVLSESERSIALRNGDKYGKNIIF